MSSAPNPKPAPNGAAAAGLFVFCLALGGAGLALDFIRTPTPAFWIGAAPGARAVIGAAAAVLVVLAAHLVRVVLAQRTKGGSDAGDHA